MRHERHGSPTPWRPHETGRNNAINHGIHRGFFGDNFVFQRLILTGAKMCFTHATKAALRLFGTFGNAAFLRLGPVPLTQALALYDA